MLSVFLALVFGILAQACHSLPAFDSPSAPQLPYTSDTLTVSVSYSLWYSNSSALVKVNEEEMILSASSANFVIAQPTNGFVTITTTSPLGINCVSPGTLRLVDAQNGVVIACEAMLQLTNQQPAAYVIGQPTMTSATFGSAPNSGNMNVTWGLATQGPGDANLLFAADQFSNRVLAFALPIAGSQPSATFLLGQDGQFTTTADAATQSNLSQPLSLNVVNDTLVVADANNNRVLIFHTLPTDASAQPDTVVGQPSFTTAWRGCDAGSFQFPMAAVLAAGRLYVADTRNNRVLLWLTIPQAGVAPPADGVIGQPSFTSCAPAATPSSNTLLTPRGLHWDGSYFYIADSSNHRVLIYQGAPDASTNPAYLVGQQDYQKNTACGSAECLNLPKGITSDANTIYVVDTNNDRVLGYYRAAVFGSAMGAPPRPYVVLGQYDPSTSMTNTGASSVTFNSPTVAAVIGSQLFVSDSYNYRVLIFNSN